MNAIIGKVQAALNFATLNKLWKTKEATLKINIRMVNSNAKSV